MFTRILALSTSLILLSPAAFAQTQSSIQLEPVAEASQSVDGLQSVNQSLGRVSVSLRYLANPDKAQVFHPNGKGKLSDQFSPYAYKNIVNTHVFRLTIQNNEGQALNADSVQVQVSLNGLPYTYLDRQAMMKQWRHYYYLNTNTITGAPDFMEQERAIVAENFIEKNAFQAQDIPAGGQTSGLIAIPALEQSGSLKVRIRHLGNGNSPEDFVFRYNAQ